MSNEMFVSVVLPAGGSGVRLGSETPKQFIDVLGKPVICYALESFSRFEYRKTILTCGNLPVALIDVLIGLRKI